MNNKKFCTEIILRMTIETPTIDEVPNANKKIISILKNPLKKSNMLTSEITENGMKFRKEIYQGKRISHYKRYGDELCEVSA